ncbi:MAG: hypothetical protein LBR26_16005 [Prevotella sp.]|nr:hypothetical protein [Prevotella sp.]
MKTIKYYLLDMTLTIVLFVTIGICVHSCKKCNDRMAELQEQKEHQIPNIQID